ncbi:LOW QUALITY PROTEIN: uncharacterized protein LOC119611393 [Lucilia sericata]|uniref:LOW QUALITY PROTEIN: uncharacterized protein LOC119611393 n=1 Tax=Lucilia sericata TaxID=13632 RepID=UPI0018A82278|nr:LOW QUALITY PROTEIN: uncharacterized protein LOC119611393 [Lucilia sericata]
MSIYNEDELVPPSWINQEFLQKVLKQYENNEHLKINNFVLSPATLKGDHYGSIMFRCKLTYDLDMEGIKQQSFVIKTIPEEKCSKRDMLGESGVFETEISMSLYIDISLYTLPKIEKILQEIGEPTKMAAQLIYHSLEPHQVIIIEDLCEAGYNTIRGRHLTEDEIKMVYTKIAKFHAVSHLLSLGEDHEIVTKYEKGFFSNSAIMSMDFIRNGIWNFIQMLSEHQEFSVYLEKVKLMQPHMMKSCMDLYNAYKLNKGQGDIFVLNHGDFHNKNLMFKFNKQNQLDDVIFVDYQLNCFAPSAVDTIYSQYTMLSPELRLRRNEFMLHYFTEFIRVLKSFKYQGELPRYSDFQIAGYKYRYFALLLMSTFVPMFGDAITSKAEDLKDFDSSNFLENAAAISLAYKNTRFLTDMRNYLPEMLRDGYLD